MRNIKNIFVMFAVMGFFILIWSMEMSGNYDEAMKNGMEDSLPLLLSIAGLILWMRFIRMRIMQKSVLNAIMLVGMSMILWMAVRLLKWQFPSDSIENRYLWYSFYPFIMLMVSSFLWLALAVGKEKDEGRPPYCMRIIFGIQILLLFLIYTNNFHQLVFCFDLPSLYSGRVYSYGYGYFAVYAGYMIPLLCGVVTLCIKSWNSPRRIRFLIPLSVLALMILYFIAYLFRVTFVFRSDLTLISFLFIMVFSESALRSGMIPTNTKYYELFYESTLKMQLFQKNGQIAMAAFGARRLPEEIKNKLFSMEMPAMLQSKENIIWFANKVTGGKVVWAEDIGEIIRIKNEISAAAARLKEADRILELEKEEKYKAASTRASEEIFELMDKEVGSKLKEMRNLLMQPSAIDTKWDLREIRLLATYIKRRCSFLFYMEYSTISSEAMKGAVEEILEVGETIGMKNICLISLSGEIPAFLCLLIYDFVFYILYRLFEKEEDLILRCRRENNQLICTIIASADFTDFVLPDKLIRSMNGFKGRVIHKHLEGAQSLTMEVFCCHEGGEKDHA